MLPFDEAHIRDAPNGHEVRTYAGNLALSENFDSRNIIESSILDSKKRSSYVILCAYLACTIGFVSEFNFCKRYGLFHPMCAKVR